MNEPAWSVQAADLRFEHRAQAGDVGFALRVPSWRVARGAMVAVHGPSGCGKSTLLALLAGVLPVSGGHLAVEGVALERLGDAARRAHRIRLIGQVFQDFPLVEHLDAVENVLLPYRINPALRLDAGARSRACVLLAGLGLGARGAHRPGALSQGERQRVAIARALVTEPTLVLADEPTAGLDAARAAEVVELLQGLCRERGATLILVSHDPAVLSRFDEQLDVAALSRSGGP